MNGPGHAYWLEQAEADVPAADEWLSAEERERLAGMRFQKRWTEWRLGRWTAKRAVAWRLNLPGDVRSLQDLEIRAAPSGAPEVFLFNQRADVSLSLSHRAGRALCFVASSEASLGCDLELVETRDDSFLTDFFTTNEQTLLDRAPGNERAALATLLWSAKESALKALQVGLRLDTTCVEVRPSTSSYLIGEHTWSPLSLRCVGDRILRGWWRNSDGMIRTLVFNPLH
jgi:4'-phosphopantetheinyl transferase